ncbi:MAG: hypothetical protein AABY49_07590 [Planctomycetota bacterium]
MKKIKIYLDTSVINFLYADDVPELKKVTEEFFAYVKGGQRYNVYVSDVVINEINKTNDPLKKQELLSIIGSYRLTKLPNFKDVEISALAEMYLNKGVMPRSKIEDALHIAYAVVFEIDVLLSWNFKHLANIKQEREVLIVNIENGYNYPLRIVTPMEVDYEDSNDV